MYKEKIQTLAKAISQIPDAERRKSFFSALEDRCESFPDYVNSVVSMELKISVARFKCNDIAEFQDVVRNADISRRNSHLNLVASINVLNRMSEMLSLDPFYTATINGIEYGAGIKFDEERDCRAAAANAAKDFVDELYYDGRHRKQGLDITYEMEKNQDRVDSEMVMSKILDDEQIL